jgi:hypothetical protein
MPKDLHQQLSEFSYGYGVTREVERSLRLLGLRTTPFLPSLVKEGEVAFDVKFDRPGLPIILQFKLGQQLERFVRPDTSKPAPPLERPFWRFRVNTAELGGQFDVLLKAERSGKAEAYYIAPRFALWEDYASAFQTNCVVDQSLLISPRRIDEILRDIGEPDGLHRIVYDSSKVFVCSDPARVEEMRADLFAEHIRSRVGELGRSIAVHLREVVDDIAREREIRRPTRSPGEEYEDTLAQQSDRGRALARRAQIRDGIRARARSPADADFAVIGMEAWVLGAQMIGVTEGD